MEKLKSENLKEIEIKLEGNNCIISYPSSKISLVNEVTTFPQLDKELKGNIDLNLSVSSTSEDFITNLKKIKNINEKENDSNSKKKLEITNKSIFCSESFLKKSSSDRNFHLSKKMRDIKNKNKDCIIKNSVIKKLNFDLYETMKNCDKNKKVAESERNKNEDNYLYKNHNKINTNKNIGDKGNYSIEHIFINNNNKGKNCLPKNRKVSLNNNEHKNKKEENSYRNSNNVSKDVNQTLIRKKKNNSFVLSNPFNNKRILYINNNNNIKISEGNPKITSGKRTLNKMKYKGEIKISKNKNENKKSISPKIVKNSKIKKNFEKLNEEKNSLRSNYLRFKSSGNLSFSNNLKKKEKKRNINNKNEKSVTKSHANLNINNNVNNKKNMFCIKKLNKKQIPYLISNNINNINPKNEKLLNKEQKNEYCTLKQYYYLKTPYVSNLQGSSTTPITSTNGYTNCTNSSTINSPSITTSKFSNVEDKNQLTKYYSHNSLVKDIVNNTINQNNAFSKNILNFNKYQKVRHKNSIEQNINQNKYCHNKSRCSLKRVDDIKLMKSFKISEINNKKRLNGSKTKKFKVVIKGITKPIHKILTERNIKGIAYNNSFSNRSNFFDNSSKIINHSNINYKNDLKEIKKRFIKKNFDKK